MRTGSIRRSLPPIDLAALKSALSFGKHFSPILGTLEEVVDIASKPVVAKILAPSKMPVLAGGPIIQFSSSGMLTGALAAAGSAAAGVGLLVSVGFYGSTTGEVGIFSTIGGGLFFNTPVLPSGGEVTAILGTPVDFSGPYFGVSVGVGTLVGAAFTVLFAPTLPLTLPMTLTLMGVAFNISAVTPTRKLHRFCPT